MTDKTYNFTNLLYYNPVAHGFNPIVSATITGPETIDEGASATFDAVAWDISNGPVYWWVTNLVNITTDRISPGLVSESTISNNRSSFTVTASADNTTASGAQSYTVAFGKVYNTPLASITVTVNDTSRSVLPTNNFDFYAGGAQNALGHDDWWLAPSGWWKYGEIFGPPAHTLITYPDSSNDKVWVFTGSEQLVSPDLKSWSGAFSGNAITIQMWFYPTADNVTLLSECGQSGQQNGAGWHASVFDLIMGTVRARLWQGATVYAAQPYLANAWNHVYLTADDAGHMYFELNGTPGQNTPQYLRDHPLNSGISSEYFVVGYAETTNQLESFPANAFKGYLGQINVADGSVPSNFNNERAKHGL